MFSGYFIKCDLLVHLQKCLKMDDETQVIPDRGRQKPGFNPKVSQILTMKCSYYICLYYIMQLQKKRAHQHAVIKGEQSNLQQWISIEKTHVFECPNDVHTSWRTCWVRCHRQMLSAGVSPPERLSERFDFMLSSEQGTSEGVFNTVGTLTSTLIADLQTLIKLHGSGSHILMCSDISNVGFVACSHLW